MRTNFIRKSFFHENSKNILLLFITFLMQLTPIFILTEYLFAAPLKDGQQNFKETLIGTDSVGDDDAPDQPSATIFNLKGDVRIKPTGNVLWVKAIANAPLFPGDKVYTGSDGSAQVRYLTTRNVLEMKPFSMMRIGYQAPRMSQFKRQFGTERQVKKDANTQGNAREVARAGVRILSRPDDIGFEPDASASAEPMADLEVRKIGIASPQSKTILGLIDSAGKISIQVEKDFKQEKLWAYVWQKNKGSTPVQKIFSKGDFPEIKIAEPGKYIIQVICEDESCASSPLWIDAVKGTREELLDLLSKIDPNEHVTVVFP